MLRSGTFYFTRQTSFPLINTVRNYAKMDRYKFLKDETTKETQNKITSTEKKKRRVTVTPAGIKEHTPNPIPPKLRGKPIPEEFDVPIEQQKSISVALLGPPNVGKSTLLNKILKDHVTATSSKSQTTRVPIVGFTTIDNTQLVFLDTPGIIDREKQKQLSRSLVVGSWSVLDHADLGWWNFILFPFM